MTSKAALFALLAVWGIGLGGSLPARAEDPASDPAPAELSNEAGMAPAGLTNRVWQKSGAGDDLPGVIRIFLSDGTLVQDSCWETHRLSRWKMRSASDLTWNEDGTDVDASITDLSADSLTLVLRLRSGLVEERYTAAPVRAVCPDMPRA